MYPGTGGWEVFAGMERCWVAEAGSIDVTWQIGTPGKARTSLANVAFKCCINVLREILRYPSVSGLMMRCCLHAHVYLLPMLLATTEILSYIVFFMLKCMNEL